VVNVAWRALLIIYHHRVRATRIGYNTGIYLVNRFLECTTSGKRLTTYLEVINNRHFLTKRRHMLKKERMNEGS
jgi:hypothetical protein